MVNKLRSDLPKIFRYDLYSFKLLFSKEKIHFFYLLNFGTLYFSNFFFILYRALQKEINAV